MNLANVVKLLLFIILQICYVDGACTLPTELDGQWWDSRTSTVTFVQNTGKVSSGWSITAFSNTVSTFTCVDSDSSYWLFKSDNLLPIYSVDYYVYYCVKYTKITDYSYYYYLDSNAESDAGNQRIISTAVGTSFATTSNCNPTSGPGVEEFHVLVQKDKQADVKQWFPEPLLGVFAYSVEDSSSSGICGTDSVWDGCTNRTTITLNYTKCATTMFGSTDGVLYATKYFTSGSTSYVIIIDGSALSSQRFTCLAVSGTSVSSNPGSCQAGQIATARTSESSSVLISLSAYETCPLTTSSSSSSNAGAVAAAVVVVLLLIIGAIVGFILYYKCYKKQPFPWQKSSVENGLQENAEKGQVLPDNVVEVDTVSPKSSVDSPGKKKSLPFITKAETQKQPTQSAKEKEPTSSAKEKQATPSAKEKQATPSAKEKEPTQPAMKKQPSQSEKQKESTQPALQKQKTQSSIEKQKTQMPIQKQPTQAPIQKQPTQMAIQKQPTQSPNKKQPTKTNIKK